MTLDQEGGRGRRYCRHAAAFREKPLIIPIADGREFCGSNSSAGTHSAWRRAARAPRGAARSSAAGRRASGSIAGSSRVDQGQRRAAHGSSATRSRSAAQGWAPCSVDCAVEEAEQLAVPAGQGAERPRGRRRSASPTSALSSSSIQAMRSAGWRIGGRARRRGGDGRRRRARSHARAAPAGRPAARARQAAASSSTGSAPRDANSPSSWRFSMPSGKRRPERATLARKRARPSAVARSRSSPAPREDLARQRHGRGDRAARTPRRRARARSCRGRARRAGTGSGTVRVSTACGRLASRARPAARRPAASPSKLKTTESVKRTSFCTCSAVHAVPSVATAFSKPAWARATTSM